MIQRTFRITGTDELEAAIDQMAAHPASRSLLLVFEEGFSAGQAKDVATHVHARLPELPICGCTSLDAHGGSCSPGETMLTLSFISFEDSSAEPVLCDLDGTSEWDAASTVSAIAADMEDLRGVLVLASGTTTMSQHFVERLHVPMPSVPIFGICAAISLDDSVQLDSYVLMGDETYGHAVLAVLFRGRRLHIMSGEELGWTPIGQRMRVTAVERPNTVLEFDRRPAVDIYRKYLGLSPDQVNVLNTREFPLVRRVGNHMVARICIESREDGAVLFGAPLRVGEEVQFAYGSPSEILRVSETNARAVTSFSPQAALVIACGNRVNMLDRDWARERGMFVGAHPDTVIVHGRSELYMDDQGGGKL